jgi:hypothetical protein
LDQGHFVIGHLGRLHPSDLVFDAKGRRGMKVKKYRIKDLITLTCPMCPATVIVPRVPGDPTDAVKAMNLCPKCLSAAGETTVYFDKNGKEVTP